MALQHGFTIEPTSDADLNRLQQRIKKALDTLASAATAAQLTDKATYVLVGSQELQNNARGANLTAASTIHPTTAYHRVGGATACNFMAISGTFDGFRAEFHVVNGMTFNHNAASPPAGAYALFIQSGAPIAKSAGQAIAFRRDDVLKLWVQIT